METHRKSIMKAITWRIIGTLDTFVISLVVSGSAKVGATIAATEVLTKVALFYVHERAWSRVK